MNQTAFEESLEQLTRKQRQVLKHFLSGIEDIEITKLIGAVDSSAVRQHVSNIGKRFGFSNVKGEHFSFRDELIELFLEHKSDWVCQRYQETYGKRQTQRSRRIERPGSPLAVASEFYIQRDRDEPYLDEVLQPGGLLRIRAPHKMGKTSLLNRLRVQLREEDCQVVSFNLRSAVDQQTAQNLPQFLRWFCGILQDALDLEPKLATLPQTKDETSKYFQTTVLKQLQTPLVLILDEADWLFENPVTAKDFFMLLRGWHEFAKDPDKEIWEQLRLVIAHATDDYLKFDSSPFGNVGVVVSLAPLTAQQIQQLVSLYNLEWLNPADISRLMNLIGGHPDLIQKALYHLKETGKQTLDQLLELAPTLQGIYASHLMELSQKLKSQPILDDALKQVVQSRNVILTPEQVFKLEGLGLVQREGNQVRLSCELYRQFFQSWA